MSSPTTIQNQEVPDNLTLRTQGVVHPKDILTDPQEFYTVRGPEEVSFTTLVYFSVSLSLFFLDTAVDIYKIVD